MHALACSVEEADHLGGLRPLSAHEVGHSGVELRGLARTQYEVLFAEQQAEFARKHVEPLVAFVRARCALGSAGMVSDFECAHLRLDAGERRYGEAVVLRGCSSDSGIGHLLFKEIVDPDAELPREGEQELETGLALARLQARKRADRYARTSGKLGKCPATLLTGGTQARADLSQFVHTQLFA